MTTVLVFLGCLMACIVWWLVRQTVNVKPWVAGANAEGLQDYGVAQPGSVEGMPSVKVGLGVFMVVATSVFALFLSAYDIRMELDDWRPLREPDLLWFNTALLVFASIALQWGWTGAKKDNEAQRNRGLIAGGILALGFIIGQLMAWQELTAAGLYISSNPANAFFYTLTALHGLHLLGGLVAWAKTANRVWRADAPAAINLGLELCTWYWHYLLVIWLVLFGLMLST